MNTNTAEGFYKRADQLLNAAEHEEERAEEDVVTHFICTNSRQSISDFMKGYLLEKNVAIRHPASIDSLYKQCQASDKRFNNLDLNNMVCRYELNSGSYCLDKKIVDQCLDIARKVKSIVRDHAPVH